MHLDALLWAAAWMGTMGGASLVAGAGIEPAQGGLWARCHAIWLPRTKIGVTEYGGVRPDWLPMPPRGLLRRVRTEPF